MRIILLKIKLIIRFKRHVRELADLIIIKKQLFSLCFLKFAVLYSLNLKYNI